MFPASTKAGGVCLGAPDVCKTPAGPAGMVPIPYPNTGMLNLANNTSAKVKIVDKEVITLKSEIPSSSGDEAGVGGGVVSGQNMNKVQFKMGSMKVKIEGQPCIHLLSVTGHNGSNANMPAGAVIAPSQVKVIILG
ncbi:MAG: DUF4150 domain-containing protein [Candidatus Latescibacterota bacterium]|jgi:hypothetical protein